MGTIIAWIIIGGLAGWIASKIMKRDAQMGIGACLVIWLFSLISGRSKRGTRV